MAIVFDAMRFSARLGAVGLLILATGCQSGGGLGLGGGTKSAEPAQAKITVDELRAYCPRVALQSGTAFYNTYERGGEGDKNKIVYQVSIADVTRSCAYNGGTLTMTVAAAGKIVPGPVAKGGTVTMPIRIVATRGEEVLYSKLHKHQVQMAANAPATQFLFSDPNVTIPAPTARNIEVLVGFDEGPAAK